MYLSGFHKHVFADGSVYEGDWFEYKKHGSGTNHYATGGSYTGEFANGLRHGTGTYIYPDGDVYIGEFNLGNREGRGKYIFIGGGHYEGEWLHDQMHGLGCAVDASGKTLRGWWRYGRPDGQCWIQDGSNVECVTYGAGGAQPTPGASRGDFPQSGSGDSAGGAENKPWGWFQWGELEGPSWLNSAVTCLGCTTNDLPGRRKITSGPAAGWSGMPPGGGGGGGTGGSGGGSFGGPVGSQAPPSWATSAAPPPSRSGSQVIL